VDGCALRVELAYAGCRFEFEGPAELLAQLERVPYARLCTNETAFTGNGSEVTRCSVALLDPARGATLGGPREARRIGWSWHEDRAHMESWHARAQLRGTGAEQRFEAQLTANRSGAQSLLTGLSAALLHRRGGAMLHAASIELHGAVIALIGPSGAGKSTASRQLEGGRRFSVDRLAVAPEPGNGWLAFPLPGGTRSALDPPVSTATQGPLRAILRVRKAASGVAIDHCPMPMALALLRQAAFFPRADSQAELELLVRLQRLATEVPVANLHSSLGTMLATPVGRWLSDRHAWKSGEGQTFYHESDRDRFRGVGG
jgi:hypothetical protein